MKTTLLKPRHLITAACAAIALLGTLLQADTPVPFSIGPNTLPAMQAGKGYSTTLTTTGATPPVTWTVNAIPPGLALNATTGVLSGTPSAAGNYVLFVKATDALNLVSQKPWNVNVAVAAPATGGGNTGGGSTSNQYTVAVGNGTMAGGATNAVVAPGTVVTITANPPPSGQWLKTWTGNVALANAMATTTTFTMPWSNVSVTATFSTPPSLTQPVTGHPRLWLKQNDVTRLRGWAVPTNLIYQQGLRNVLATALTAYSKCFPNGQPASPYPDLGDIYGYSGAAVGPYLVSEHHEMVLAFFGLIDPSASNRVAYAQKARAMLMYEMNEAAKGHLANTPFRDPLFALFNRPHTVGESWPLIVDWLQGVTDANGQPVAILSAQDKKTIRDVFIMWANDCLNAYICGGDHPAPVGTTNSTALLPNGNAHRVAANNYYSCHARLMTMMPMALDAADDQPINTAAPAGVLGNTLRSYLPNATGAWLYQQFAMYGDPAAVRTAFNLPTTASVGLSSGGLPLEGGLYGHSYGYVLGQLLALQTAGFNNTSLSGPQISLIGAPVWDRFVKGFMSQMVNTPATFAANSYMGAVYQMASYADLLRLYVTQDFMQPFALLALTEQQQGLTTHLNEARWFAINALPGGASNLISHVASPWNTAESILYFMLFDPAAPAPTDPRPAYATSFFDAPQARLISRTDWSPNATFFTYRAAPATINHVNPDAGQFEIWRKGEWLTKELSNYDGYGIGQSSIWHNTLTLKNWCSAGIPTLNTYEATYFTSGSMYNNGMSGGDPVSVSSCGTGFNYVQTDLTSSFNRPSIYTPSNALIDIQHASRSIMYLKNDFVVIYDRASSLHSGCFKRFNLNFNNPPVLDSTNKQLTETTPKGQKLFVKTLLPANASYKWIAANLTALNAAELETTAGRVEVEDLTLPTSTSFLHVLQAADATTARAAATLVQSTAGNAFQGAQFGSSLVMFASNLTTAFTGTTYTAPSAATTHYVTGLTPNASYSITEQWDALGNIQVTIANGGTFTADKGGVLCFTP